MSLSQAKRNSMRLYLLHLIERGERNCVSKTAEEFEVSHVTVYKAISALIAENVIKKDGRGAYSLVLSIETFRTGLAPNASEEAIYNQFFKRRFERFPDNIRAIWEYILSEMLNNAIDHSEADKLELSIISDALVTSVIVADNGIGVFKKIMDCFNFSSTEEAAGELLKGKVTTDKKNHSGEGIFFSSRAADRFVLASGERIVTYKNMEAFGVDVQNFIKTPVEGTAVFVSLSNYSQKRLKDVFDSYADVEGGFNKTKIPIAVFFDGVPVSRSQAKRLCNRLDEFSEVILDFANVEWMGQGFAHQVFVVFRREHPGIKLEPVNMSESVESMYKHVIITS